jgi:endothelin-converting enzyme
MDEETIKKDDIKPLMNLLHQVADHFPVKELAYLRKTPLTAEDNDALSSTILKLSEWGVSALVSLGAGADDKDPVTVAGIPIRLHQANRGTGHGYHCGIFSP